MILKTENKEYQIRFAYIPTVKGKLIQHLMELESKANTNSFDAISDILEMLPEMVLIGLQKFHKDEFGYDYDTLEGKAEALAKVYNIIDDYFDSEDADLGEFYNELQDELTNNGFLKSLLKQEAEKVSTKKKVTTAKKITEQRSYLRAVLLGDYIPMRYCLIT